MCTHVQSQIIHSLNHHPLAPIHSTYLTPARTHTHTHIHTRTYRHGAYMKTYSVSSTGAHFDIQTWSIYENILCLFYRCTFQNVLSVLSWWWHIHYTFISLVAHTVYFLTVQDIFSPHFSVSVFQFQLKIAS